MAAKRRSKGLPPPKDFGLDDTLYQAWIIYAFDRPVTKTPWTFDIDLAGFEASPVETVGLIGCTMARSGDDLAGFSDAQAYHGLNFMLNEAFDPARCFGHPDVAALAAFRNLYKDCFAPRCLSCLGHLNEGGANKLNMIAYMLWDTSPILPLNRHHAPVMDAFAEVASFALGSSNDACIESALHGLGHQVFSGWQTAVALIDRFLENTCDAESAPRNSALRPIRTQLRDYARQARTGCIL